MINTYEVIYANGAVYEGQMRNEQRHGYGRMIYSSGNIFIGKWVQNQPNKGMKIFTNRDVRLINGDWRSDRISLQNNFCVRRIRQIYRQMLNIIN